MYTTVIPIYQCVVCQNLIYNVKNTFVYMSKLCVKNTFVCQNLICIYVQYSYICQKQICMSELHCYVKNTLQLVGMSKLTVQLTISLDGQSDPYMYIYIILCYVHWCTLVYIGYIYCKKLSVVLTFCGYLSVHILL